MKGQIYILGFILLTLWGCERKIIDPNVVVESPYKLVGSIDGQDYTVDLGANQYRLTPTFQRSSFGVYQFIADYDNASSQENLRIYFNDDSREWNSENVDAGGVLEAGSKEFQTLELSLSHNILEIRGEEVNGVDYQWTFNETVSEESGPIVDPLLVDIGNELSIGLKLKEEGLTVDSLVLIVDQAFLADTPVDYNFFYPEYIGDQVVCRYDGDLSKVDYITWSGQRPDGTFLVAEQSSNVVISNLQDGVYNILMTVQLQNGVSFKHSRHVVYPSDSPEQMANVQFRTHVGEGDVNYLLNDVVVVFEQNGKTYSSVNSANGESGDLEFEVIDQWDQITNNFGQSAQELVVRFSCDMQNTEDGSDILEFRDFQGTIVVAFPTPID